MMKTKKPKDSWQKVKGGGTLFGLKVTSLKPAYLFEIKDDIFLETGGQRLEVSTFATLCFGPGFFGFT